MVFVGLHAADRVIHHHIPRAKALGIIEACPKGATEVSKGISKRIS